MWLIRTCDMTHAYVCHDSFIRLPWLRVDVDMTHSQVSHDSFIRVLWLIHTCAMTHLYVCHDSFSSGPWLVHTCVMTHSYVCHDSFICVPRLLHLLHTLWRHVPLFNSFITVTWLTNSRDTTHSYLWHIQCTRVTWLIHTRDIIRVTWLRVDVFMTIWNTPCADVSIPFTLIRVTWRIRMFDVSNSYVWRDSFTRVTSQVWHDSGLTLSWQFDARHAQTYFPLYSFIRVTWRIHTCDMTQSRRCHDCLTDGMHRHIFPSTLSYAWHDVWIRVTWLRFDVVITICRTLCGDVPLLATWHEGCMHLGCRIHTV